MPEVGLLRQLQMAVHVHYLLVQEHFLDFSHRNPALLHARSRLAAGWDLSCTVQEPTASTSPASFISWELLSE